MPILMWLIMVLKLYQTKIWQASLPDGWEARMLLFDAATLFKPEGIGEISVLVAPLEHKLPTEAQPLLIFQAK